MEILEAKTFEYRFQVTEKDLDVFGHVNNSKYLNYYELARWNFITSNGFGLKYIQEHQKGPVLLNVELQFRKELKNREWCKVISQAKKIDGRFLSLYQEIVKESDQKIASKATFTIAYFDLKERKLLEPDENWLGACGITLK